MGNLDESHGIIDPWFYKASRACMNLCSAGWLFSLAKNVKMKLKLPTAKNKEAEPMFERFLCGFLAIITLVRYQVWQMNRQAKKGQKLTPKKEAEATINLG